MSDYTNSKKAGTFDFGTGLQGKQYPEGAAETKWGRLEPLLEPEQLVARQLWGIPLISKFKDLDTGKPMRITDDMLKDYIQLAVDEAEQETGLIIMPTRFQEKLSYQKQDYESFSYLQLPHRPVSSIETLSVTLADGSAIFEFPLMWVETANLIHGQLNLLPLAFQSGIGGTGIIGGDPGAGSGGTAVFFNSLWSRNWVAALFGVSYTAGFINGMLPKAVNELIGCIAAMKVLSMLAATYARSTSQSLGIDGMSQGWSGPGPQVFALRMTELAAQRKLLVKKLKRQYATNFVSGTV